MYTPQRSHAGLYGRIQVETGVHAADPHYLIAMLFDGLAESIAQARGAMRDGNVALKGRAIGRAVRIVDEGLRGALDMESGGQLSADLSALYQYIVRRLTEANLHNDEGVLNECATLIQPIREAWAAIRPGGSNASLPS